LQYETFLAEESDCLNWCAVGVDHQLHTIIYGHHDFRAQPCMEREGYWRYLQRVIQKGIDIGADGFGFDNVCNTRIPDVCHCPQCRAAFVAYLKAKFRPDTPEGAKLATERFGFCVLDHIRLPTFNRWNPAVDCKIIINPVFQEWTDFRTDGLARRCQEIWHFIKGQRPDIMIEYNVYPALGENSAWIDGIDMHKLLPWMDASWNERFPKPPQITRDGAFWHRVHGYKLAEAYGCLIFTFHADLQRQPGPLSLAASECMMFNAGQIGGFGRINAFAAGGSPEADDVIQFRKAHGELFENTQSAAKVGVVESALSLARNCVEPRYVEIMSLISLLAGQVPFDLVPELTQERIAPYQALVLPDTEILTDEEARLLLAYVHQGGGLVFTGRTGAYDAWRRRRSELALSPLLNAAKRAKKIDLGADAAEAANVAQSAAPGVRLQGVYGKGRFVYISQLVPFKPFDYAKWSITDDLWNLPKNFAEFVEAVRFAQGETPIQVIGPKTLAAEIRTAPDGRTLIHLLNYRVGKAATGVRIKINGLKFKAAKVWMLGQPKLKVLKAAKTVTGMGLSVGVVPCYAVVELR